MLNESCGSCITRVCTGIAVLAHFSKTDRLKNLSSPSRCELTKYVAPRTLHIESLLCLSFHVGHLFLVGIFVRRWMLLCRVVVQPITAVRWNAACQHGSQVWIYSVCCCTSWKSPACEELRISTADAMSSIGPPSWLKLHWWITSILIEKCFHTMQVWSSKGSSGDHLNLT